MDKLQRKLNEAWQKIEESSFSRVWKFIIDDSTFAVVSAFLGDDEELDLEEHKKLAKQIRSMGYGYIPLDSGYSYSDEDRGHTEIKNEKSYLVPNITYEDAMSLGKKFGQESILWKDSEKFVLVMVDSGKVSMEFSKSEKGNLTTDKEKVKQAFSALVSSNKSQKGKKFAFVGLESVKEMRSNSIGSYKYQSTVDPLPLWINIF